MTLVHPVDDPEIITGQAGLGLELIGDVADLRPVVVPSVAVISGGNVDAGLLAAIMARAETNAGRRLRVYSRVGDRPGGLAKLLTVVAASDANLLAVDHVRDGVELHVRETGSS